MLRLGPHIRLTQAEIDYLTHITGFAPGPIRRLDDLHRYINPVSYTHLTLPTSDLV